jgi:trk system potassium uptake protein TrkA
MHRYTIIGLGNFGSYLATRLYDLGHEVIAIDTRQDVVDRIGPDVTRAIAADATDAAVLRELGVGNSDSAVVSTGNDLGASVLALLALRDTGVPEIFVKVHSDQHRRIVDALGAAESVFPERQAAQSLAARMTSGKLLRYVELGDEFGLQEMPVPDAWVGKSLRELALPSKHKVQVVALHDILRDSIEIPDADRTLTPSDTLLVAATPSVLEALTRLG